MQENAAIICHRVCLRKMHIKKRAHILINNGCRENVKIEQRKCVFSLDRIFKLQAIRSFFFLFDLPFQEANTTLLRLLSEL